MYDSKTKNKKMSVQVKVYQILCFIFKLNKNMSLFQVSIDFWATSEGLHASDSLSFSNFGIIETHEGESVNLVELKGYLHVMVLP